MSVKQVGSARRFREQAGINARLPARLCKSIDGALADSKYAVTPVPSGDTLRCRFYQLVKALSGTPSCAAAVGGAPCQ